MRRGSQIFGLVLTLALAGCDRRVEPYVTPEEEPARPTRPVRIPGLENPVPRSGAARLGGDNIRGTVRLAKGLAAPSGGVLFVIARSQGGGPPLAVKRLPAGPFPMAFQIGAADVMVQGRPFKGPIHLSARIDSDGQPLTRDPSDPAAEAQLLEPGATGIELVLGIH